MIVTFKNKQHDTSFHLTDYAIINNFAIARVHLRLMILNGGWFIRNSDSVARSSNLQLGMGCVYLMLLWFINKT